jgi:hypothetical protein
MTTEETNMLATLLPILLPILSKGLAAIIPDPEARERAVADLVAKLSQSDLAQMEIDRVEAANASLFVAGWRPFIGWTCGAALAYQYVAVPIVIWMGFLLGHPVPKPPTLDDQLWQLMLGMLGMAGLRTIEKKIGTAK